MYLIKSAQIVNEGAISTLDVFVKDQRIQKIGANLNVDEKVKEIDGSGLYLLIIRNILWVFTNLYVSLF